VCNLLRGCSHLIHHLVKYGVLYIILVYMDTSCNKVCDISRNNVLDISCNNINAKYCIQCNKLLTESIFFYGELCVCPLRLEMYNGFNGQSGYIDCSFIEYFMEDAGPTGPTGPTGPVGPKGEVVFNGPTGATGYIGPIGQIGPTGAKGNNGDVGMTGPTGPTGPKGDTGMQGNNGEVGAVGPKGDTGDVGMTGPKGDTGMQGNNGEMGMTGPKGETGMPGNNGEIGMTGPTGETGPAGLNGMPGINGLNGPTGPQGSTGPKGDTGNTFITNGLIYQTFITAYSLTDQVLSVDEPIIFDTHSALFGDCLHIDNSPDIWLWKPGNYMVSIVICPIERCQFSFIKNTTTIIPGATFGVNALSSQTSITFIMLLDDTDFTEQVPSSTGNVLNGCRIQVVNTSSLTETVTLYSSSNPMPQVTTSITIMRLTP
jgi:hypothetical protein